MVVFAIVLLSGLVCVEWLWLWVCGSVNARIRGPVKRTLFG